MKLAHVLLTRFNLPSPGAESLVRAREGWLRHRERLFERYCVPSVRAQTNQDFHWLIYFDPRSPQWLRHRIEGLSSDGLFMPAFRTSVAPAELRADIQRLIDGVPDRLITTNVDNDDGLAVDFVERVRKADPGDGRSAIYVRRGLITTGTRLYLRHDRYNAFCSVAEPWPNAVTCWMDWHNALARHMPVIHVSGQPGWLQVVHEGNVSNRVRGRLANPEPHESTFGDLLAGVTSPSRSDLLIDDLWHTPRRAGTEAARVVVKNMVLAVSGRGGLEKLKQLRSRCTTAGSCSG